MAKVTDLNAVKRVAIQFLHLDPKPIPELPFFINHPYFESRQLPSVNNRNKFFDILEDRDEYNLYCKSIEDRILNGDIYTIFALMLTKYQLTFLKYTKEYMSKKDFETLLAHVWVASENPNQDSNVKIRTLISWFKQANKKYLMEPDELEYYNNLPSQVKVYRGVAVGRAKAEGLSWTCNYNTAEWFANRFGGGGYVLCGIIDKADVFAYFNRRGEDEVLCNSSKVRVINSNGR